MMCTKTIFLNLMMVKVRELTESERCIILGQVRAGRRQRDIALAMGVSQSTVSHIAVKFRIHNTVSNLPRSGRPKVTSPREDRRMVRLAFQQRFTTGKNFNHKKSLTQKITSDGFNFCSSIN